MSKPARREVMPIIEVTSVDAIRNFYVDTLGFEHVMGVVGKDGQFDFCTVVMGGARIMFARAPADVPSTKVGQAKQPVEIYLEVGDVQAYHDRLRKAGVKFTESLTMQWWGDRTFKGPLRLRDLVLSDRRRTEAACGRENHLRREDRRHMAIIDRFLMELEQETQTTRKLLERVPSDKLAWRPHAKSYSLGQLALHLAQIPAGLATMATGDAFEVPQTTQEEARTRQQVLDASDQGLATAKDILVKMDDTRLMEPWHVQLRGKTIMTFPRLGLLRTFLMNHYCHHRGQLSVYLRLLDVPVPSIYGPSADENPFA